MALDPALAGGSQAQRRSTHTTVPPAGATSPHPLLRSSRSLSRRSLEQVAKRVDDGGASHLVDAVEHPGTTDSTPKSEQAKVLPSASPFRRTPSLLARTKLRRLSMGPAKLFANLSRGKKEMQEKTAAYEKMMVHFQLRKLDAPLWATSSARAEDLGELDSARSVSRFYRTKTLPNRGSESPTTSASRRERAETTQNNPLSNLDFAETLYGHPEKDQPPTQTMEGHHPPVVVPQLKLSMQSTQDPAKGAYKRIRRVSQLANGNIPTSERRKTSSHPSRWRLVRRLRRRAKRYGRVLLRACAQPWTPTSLIFRVQWVVLSFVFAAQLIYLPVVPVYFSCTNDTIVRIDRMFEAVYLLDILLKFNTSYFDKKSLVLVTSRRAIAMHYLRGWLLVDVLSAVPIDLMLVRHGSDGRHDRIDHVHLIFHVFLRVPRVVHLSAFLNRLVWIVRVSRAGKELFAWLLYSRYSHLMRIMRMIILVILTAHYIACGWHLVTGENDPNAANAVPAGSSLWEQYVSDLYYAVLLIQGQGDSKGGTARQNLFSTCAVLVGSIVLAIVFGNVAMLVSNFNANSTSHQRKMEEVFATMNKLQLPHDLRDRINQYYEYVWQEYESLDGDLVKFSKGLTHTLALEVGLYRHMNLVVNVPFWRECSPDFVKQLVLNLTVRIYLPDDYVARSGEVGEEMFLVSRGVCEFTDVKHAGFDRPTAPSGAKSSRKRRDTGLSSHRTTAPKSQRESTTTENPSMDDSRDRSKVYVSSDRQRTIAQEPTYPLTSGEESGGISDTGGRTSDDAPHSMRVSSVSSFAAPAVSARLGTTKLRRVQVGESFGEMALLLNYRRTATVRAVTYVEMCVLERSNFQKLLARYPDDRSKVLRVMVASCVDKRELPLAWDDVCGLIATRRGQLKSFVLEAVESISREEIVETLVDHIDRPAIDDSILFGIQHVGPRVARPQRAATPTIARRRSNRTLSGTPLPKVTEHEQAAATPTPAPATRGADWLPSRDAYPQDRLDLLQTQVALLDTRMQAMETHHAQVVTMLQEITACLRPPRATPSDAAQPQSVATSDASIEASQPPAWKPVSIRRRLSRRSSMSYGVETIVTVESSPASATRLADALWATQAVASGQSPAAASRHLAHRVSGASVLPIGDAR